MSIAETMQRLERERQQQAEHHRSSMLINLIDRIGVLLDEDEIDEAKAEIAAYRNRP